MGVLNNLPVAFTVFVTSVAYNLVPVRDFLVRVPRVGVFWVTVFLSPSFVGVVVFPLFTPLEISGHPFGRVIGAHVHCVVWVQAGAHFVYVVVVSGVIVAYLDTCFLEAVVRVARVGALHPVSSVSEVATVRVRLTILLFFFFMVELLLVITFRYLFKNITCLRGACKQQNFWGYEKAPA